MPAAPVHALVVDDDPGSRSVTALALEELGHRTEALGDVACALEQAASDAPDVIVSDLELPCLDGFDLLAGLERQGARVPVIIVSGADEPMLDRALAAGAAAALRKPVAAEELADAVATALEIAAAA